MSAARGRQSAAGTSCGRVEAVGADVKRLRPGDEVFGETDGAFAQYVAASQDMVALKLTGLS